MTLSRKTPMKRGGKKTLAWEQAKRELKPRFQRAGITTCELHLKGCWHDNGLTFAHRVKRRFITTPEELRTVCVACLSCHQTIEKMSHDAMKLHVMAAIEGR